MPWFAEINESPVRLTLFRFFQEGTASVTLHLEWKQSSVSLFSIGYALPDPLYRALDWLVPCANDDGTRLKGWCQPWPTSRAASAPPGDPTS